MIKSFSFYVNNEVFSLNESFDAVKAQLVDSLGEEAGDPVPDHTFYIEGEALQTGEETVIISIDRNEKIGGGRIKRVLGDCTELAIHYTCFYNHHDGHIRLNDFRKKLHGT